MTKAASEIAFLTTL